MIIIWEEIQERAETAMHFERGGDVICRRRGSIRWEAFRGKSLNWAEYEYRRMTLDDDIDNNDEDPRPSILHILVDKTHAMLTSENISFEQFVAVYSMIYPSKNRT